MKNKKAILFLFLANTVTGISQGISLISITWFISNTLLKPSLFGTMFLLATGFSIPWGTFAGTLVDKYDRKKIMIAIQFLGLIIIFGAALSGFIIGKDKLWMAMLVYFSTVIAYNIHYPNLYAFAQEITEKEHYSRITSWIEIQGQTSFAIAGAVGALLLEGQVFGYEFGKWSLHEIFMLDASTYLIALFFLFSMQYQSVAERDKTVGTIFLKFKEGLRYLKSNPKILLFGVSTGLIFASILVTSMFSLPILIKNFLHGTEKVYGFTEATFAFGALLSGVLIFAIFSKKNLVLGLLILHVLSSICFLLMGVNQNIVFLYVLYGVIGFTNAGTRIMRVTYLFNVIPNKFIGRANSIFSIINASIRMVLIGVFSLSFFIQNDHIKYAMYVLCVLILLGAIALTIYFKQFKKLNQAK